MQARWSLLLVLWWGESTLAQTPSPEHKIHNIVLYPDKHSWCKTTEIKQIVTFPGCNSVEIDNNVCVGACFSYSIPRSSPAAPGEVITPYCDSCQPQHYTWKEVTLKCESADDDEDEDAVEMTKKVQVISNCTCAACHLNIMPHDSHKPTEPDAADVPELMSLMMHQQNHQREDVNEEEEEDEELDEDRGESVHHSEKTEADNFIDVDEEKNKMSHKEEVTEQSGVEVVHVNKKVTQHNTFHLEQGPHHSLILKPDILPDHHQTSKGDHPKHHEHDELVPSLLQNQFKVHDDTEFPDQLAVESRKEFADHSLEVLSVPELILKEHSHVAAEKSLASHHIQHHHKNENAKLVLNVHNPGVKIVEVPHHQLSPAVDGAHVSYVVKDEQVKEKE